MRPQGVDEQRTRITRTSLEKTSSRCRKLGQGELVQLGTRCASSLSGRVTPTRLHRLLSESVCSISPSHLLPLDVCHLTSGVDRRHLHAGTADSGVCRFIGSPLGQAVSTGVPSSCHPVLPLGERRTALSVAQSLSTTPRLVTPLTCHDTRCTRDRGSFSSSPSRRTVVTHWPCLCHQALPSAGRLTALWNAQDSRPSQMLFTPLASLDMFRSSLWRFSAGGLRARSSMILRPQGVDEQRTHVVRTSLEKTSSRCRKLGQGKLGHGVLPKLTFSAFVDERECNCHTASVHALRLTSRTHTFPLPPVSVAPRSPVLSEPPSVS